VTTTIGWFWAWVVVGIAFALGIVSLGVLLLLPAVIGAAVLGARPAARRAAWGVLFGQGLLMLYVASVQRDGPGTTCWHTATGSGCNEHLDPRPWLVIGLVLMILGVTAHVWSNERGRRRRNAG
jgi:hypothetical protein